MLQKLKLKPEDVVDTKLCRERALNFLARREHSQLELKQKLQTRGFDATVVQNVLDKLIEQNLLSDQRFGECYAAERIRCGYGPLRIQQELQQRGVNTRLIDEILSHYQTEWINHARHALQKYQRTHPAHEMSDDSQIKLQKFLHNRGFEFEHIRGIM